MFPAMQRPFPPMRSQRASGHLSFAVDDLDAFHPAMIAKDIPCLQPPEEEDFGGKLAGYADPDGLPFWVGEKAGKA